MLVNLFVVRAILDILGVVMMKLTKGICVFAIILFSSI